MGSNQSYLKNDVVNWNLKQNGSGYDINGQVLKKDIKDVEDLQSNLTQTKKIGVIAQTMCDSKSDNCLKIEELNGKTFVLSGSKQNYRLHYDRPLVSFQIGPSINVPIPSWKFLDAAYNSNIEFDNVRKLDTRSDEEINKARGEIMSFGLGKNMKINLGSNPSISIAGMDFNMFGGMPELRSECNNRGMSCRDNNGKYLSKKNLINKLKTSN